MRKNLEICAPTWGAMRKFYKQPEEQSCGECNACCVAFPLLPNEKWWPEGKKASEPCRHLKDGGCGNCGIYKDRPKVCSAFQCSYLEGRFGADLSMRPDKLGLMFYRPDLNVTAGSIIDDLKDMGYLKKWAELDDLSSVCVELRPNVLMEVDIKVIEKGVGKYIYPTMFVPYGMDLIHGPNARRVPPLRKPVWVAWQTQAQAEYACKVLRRLGFWPDWCEQPEYKPLEGNGAPASPGRRSSH